jgi:molybdopterin biosynthesis enzyme
MLGRKSAGLRPGKAVVEKEISVKPGRTQFLRGILASDGPELRVDPFPDQRSGVLKSMVKSQALIVVPAEVSRIDQGETVDILFLD